MFRDLKPYPECAHTAAGLRPPHWTARSMGSLLRQKSERNRPDLPLLSVARERGVFVRSAGDDNHNVVPDDLTNYKVARKGDLVVNKMKAWQGSMGVAPTDGVVSPAYYVYDLALENAGYAHLLLRSKPYVAHYVAASDGVRIGQWDLSDARFRRIPLSIPPVDEQEAIVTYLAHAHQRISQAIASKRRMIDLLAEERRVVARTVLQSVGGQAVALKHLLRALIDCEHKTAPFWELGSKRIVRTAGVRNGSLVLAGTYPTTDEAYDVWTRRGVPKPGDVIFTREAPAGEACVVPPDLELALGQRTVLMKPRLDRLDPAFLVHQIYSGASRQVIEIASQGSTVGHFNMSDIAALPIPLVDVSRQKELVHSIERESARLDLLSETFHREIRLLEEFRTRLTADVVTGQLDVRAVAVTLPKIDPAVVSETSNGSACEDDQEALDSDEQGEA